MYGAEAGGLSGLPFDSTGSLDGDEEGQPNAPYLTRGLLSLACRRDATAGLHCAAFAKQLSVLTPITPIANRINVITLTSS